MSVARQALRALFDSIRSGSAQNWVSLHVPTTPGDPAPGPSIYNGSTFIAQVHYNSKERMWYIGAPAYTNGPIVWDEFTRVEFGKVIAAFGLSREVAMTIATKWDAHWSPWTEAAMEQAAEATNENCCGGTLECCSDTFRNPFALDNMVADGYIH